MDGKFWDRSDTWGDDASRYVFHRNADGSVVVVGQGWGIWDEAVDTTGDYAARTDPARLVAGGNLDINGFLQNRDSQVLAGGTVTAAGIDNETTTGTRTTTVATLVTGYMASKPGTGPNTVGVLGPITSSSTVDLGDLRYASNIDATSGKAPDLAGSGAHVDANAGVAGGVSGHAHRGTLVEIAANVGAVGTTSGSGTGAVPLVVRTRTPDASIPTASLFAIRPDPGSRYLVETDARFAGYRNWLGSDYLLDRLGLDPDLVQKRLGDGFYEQRLIREQIAQLTGDRSLDGYDGDEAQYAALMSAGATFAQAYGLRPGIALTAEQMAQLTSDIVWLVEQTVTLPDGSTQRVLVPQVYVRVRQGDVDGSGALLSADAIKIKAEGSLTNTGTIAGRTLVRIDAGSIDNLGGRITGGKVALDAVNDLNNIGGTIDARDSLSLEAGRDIDVRTTTTSNQLGLNSNTGIDRVAGLYVTDPGGTLLVSAGRDANLIGAVVGNQGGGATSIKAGNDINLGTVTTSTTTMGMGDGVLMGLSTRQEVGSSISASGKLMLDAGHDLKARAAAVTAIGDLGVKAGNDITIESGRSQSALAYTAQWGGGGLLSRSSNSFQAQITTDSAIGGQFSGGNVDMQAGRDVNVVGSDVSAANGLRVAAGRNLNIISSVDTTQADAHSSRSESGVLAPRGFRVDAARGQQQSASASTQSERASHLGAGGNAALSAGEQVNIYASHVSAGQDLDVTGREVNVYSGVDQREGSYGVQNTRSSMGVTGSMGRSGTNGLSSRAGEDNRIEQTTVAPTILSGNRVNITATGGDVTLAGARIDAIESASLNAERGAVNFGVVVTGTESSQGRGGGDLMYQRNADAGARTESANDTQINSANLIIKAPQVNVQMGQNVVYGSRDEAASIPIQSLAQAISAQAGQPGMQWLTQVQNDAQLNNLQLDWQGVEVAQRHWAQSQSGLTQTGAAVVTIVASVLTWGAANGVGSVVAASAGEGVALSGGGYFLTGTGAVVSAGVVSGVSSIASQAAVSLIDNNGDIGAVLHDLSSSQGIRATLAAMASASAGAAYTGSSGLVGVAVNAAAGCVAGELNGQGCRQVGIATGLIATLQAAGYYTRQNQIESSQLFGGVVDENGSLLTNTSGPSDGVNGDGIKIGGNRIDVGQLCGVAGICVDNPDVNGNPNWINPNDGRVHLQPGISLQSVIDSNPGLTPSPLGGLQGGLGSIGGVPYAAGSFLDRLIESFAGPHDFLNAVHYYDQLGNNLQNGASETWNTIDLLPAMPVGLATLATQYPDIWQAITNVNMSQHHGRR
ncbi:hemagglutinin repeat-containing protein [Variovorax soli]|uniref:Filamentous hemagglutinin n=1 Tax=Variovorax soli TaxID=376815 RepID=A0ABU1NJ57_9BURK|nr:hemagglutinin repeat-containing protein [Variovorax soli]MDR6538035.1 hypothetical protein [Variovorax soli]